MHTRLTLALAATAACLCTQAAHAQGDIRLGLGVGVTVPFRTYADAVDRGWLGNGNLTFFPSASTSLGLRLDGFYGRNTLSAFSGHQSWMGGLASLAFQFGAKRSPNRLYLFGGGGYIRTETSARGFLTRSETSPAISGGAGATFGGKGLAFFVEARYLNVYAKGAKPQFAPITAGISFGGL
jgi:hypothetical protein